MTFFPGISHRLDDGTSERKAAYDRLLAIENEMNKLSGQFDLLRSRPHQEPAKDLNDVLSGISHRLDDGTSERKAAYDRLLAIENEMNKLSSQFDLLRSRPHQEPAKDLNDVLSGISHRLDDGTSERKAVYDRLLAIENEMKRRGSRGGFARYLVAICIGVAATLAWQSYGEVPKQVIATKAPELGWSPETKQMIASWVQQLGWTKPPAVPESTAVQPSVPETQVATVAQTVPAAVVPKAPTAPSLDPVQVQQMAQSLPRWRKLWTSSPPVKTRWCTRSIGCRPPTKKSLRRSQRLLRRDPSLAPRASPRAQHRYRHRHQFNHT